MNIIGRWEVVVICELGIGYSLQSPPQTKTVAFCLHPIFLYSRDAFQRGNKNRLLYSVVVAVPCGARGLKFLKAGLFSLVVGPTSELQTERINIWIQAINFTETLRLEPPVKREWALPGCTNSHLQYQRRWLDRWAFTAFTW